MYDCFTLQRMLAYSLVQTDADAAPFLGGPAVRRFRIMSKSQAFANFF